MNAILISINAQDSPWNSPTTPLVVGKDVLELLSSAMYIDPLAIYREYIQNAADAIDNATTRDILELGKGNVTITLDTNKRMVHIRDNGIGIPSDEFEMRMTSFGASTKRGTNARGFRGVGRLSGLGYCQELLFRSRYPGERFITETRWDCRTARALLRSTDFNGDLEVVVKQAVQLRRIQASGKADHFFEVELRGVSRLRNDCLLNPTAIADYLAQVAPVPFAPEFRFAEQIAETLRGNIAITGVSLQINCQPVYRPHRDSFRITGGTDKFSEMQPVSIPSLDGGIAAVGWILHHEYRGAVPEATLKGLRLRSGNMQIGGDDIVEDLFTERRFNSWCVGELHVLDPRVAPNGRRDHFEQDTHYANLTNRLAPIARELSLRCRNNSIKRNWLRRFQKTHENVRHNIHIIKQGSLMTEDRQVFADENERLLQILEDIAAKRLLSAEARSLQSSLRRLRQDNETVVVINKPSRLMASMSPQRRKACEQIFAAFYECSPDKYAAKLMIDRILARVARDQRMRGN